MTSWTRVSHNVASLHPLYGVKGWAVVAAIGLSIAPLKALLQLTFPGQEAARFPWLTSVAAVENVVLVVLGVSAIALLFALVNHRSWFRPGYTVYGLTCVAWPFVGAFLASAAARAHGVPLLVTDLLTFHVILSSAATLGWVMYVNLSVRIRVTCESMVPYGYEPRTMRDSSRLASVHSRPISVDS